MEPIYYSKKKKFFPSPEMIEGFAKKADFVKHWAEDSFFIWFPEKKRKAVLGKLWDDCNKLYKPEKAVTE